MTTVSWLILRVMRVAVVRRRGKAPAKVYRKQIYSELATNGVITGARRLENPVRVTASGTLARARNA
jgi:hypothetical protein